MSVHYIQRSATKGVNDSFSQILKECQEEFKTQDVNIFGSGFEDVLKDDSYFNRYEELLSAQLDDTDAANFKILANNARELMLANESSSLGSIAPWSSLSTPMIRKSWAKLAMPKALPTEAVEAPKFTLVYMTPWVRGLDGKKRKVPEDLMDFDESVGKVMTFKNTPIKFYKYTADNTVGDYAGKQSVSLFSGKTLNEMGEVDSSSFSVVSDSSDAAVIANRIKTNDQLDVKMAIVKVAFTAASAAANQYVEYEGALTKIVAPLCAAGSATAYTAADLVKVTNIELMTRTSTFKALVKLEVSVDKKCVVSGDTSGTAVNVTLFDTIMGDVDLQSGRVTLSCYGGKVESVYLRAPISSVMNNYNTEVGFDVSDKEINIGTGDHISCPIPNEYVTDLLRMYQFNGVTKLVDFMSNTIAQKLDLDAINFIDGDISDWLESMNGRFITKFSVKPVGSFVGSPSEWMKEIRRLFDYVADDLINTTYLDTGYFVILGNPLDTHIIPDVNWVFQGGQNKEINGVAANYSFGNFQGVHSYSLVSSPNVRQGYLRLYFIPTVEDQMTMKFFPYSFTVEQPGSGYNNPNAQLVPSLLSHRRYTFESILHCEGKVVVTNNDYTHRSLAGQSAYLPTSTEV